jgi:hypothetical protein
MGYKADLFGSLTSSSHSSDPLPDAVDRLVLSVLVSRQEESKDAAQLGFCELFLADYCRPDKSDSADILLPVWSNKADKIIGNMSISINFAEI